MIAVASIQCVYEHTSGATAPTCYTCHPMLDSNDLDTSSCTPVDMPVCMHVWRSALWLDLWQ